MTKSLLFAGAWIATLAVVFFIGRSTSPDENLDRRDPQPVPVPARERASRVDAGPGPSSGIAAQPFPPDRGPATEAPADTPDAPVTAEPGARDLAPPDHGDPQNPRKFVTLSRAFRVYVEKQFARGPEGTMDILREFDRLLATLRESNVDDRQAVKEFYPWLKFIVEHESETVDFLQNMLTLMAESPSAFEGIDDNSVEIFLESFAMVLPGAIPEERLAEFRALANRILAMPKEHLPEAVQKNLRELERALTFAWAAPIDGDGVVQAIRDGTLQPGQALLALKEVDLRALSRADRTDLLRVAMGVNAWEAIRALESLEPGSVDESVLDQAFIKSIADGRASSYVGRYAKATGRKTWSEVRPLIESALALKTGPADDIAFSLIRLRGEMMPDETWLKDFTARYELGDSSKDRLERTFKPR